MQGWLLQSSFTGQALITVLNAIATLVVTVAAGIYLWRRRVSKREHEERDKKLSELESAVFGVENVDHIEGMVEIMSDNQEQSEENKHRIDIIQDKVGKLEERVTNVENRIDALRTTAERRKSRRKGNKWSDDEELKNEDNENDNDG